MANIGSLSAIITANAAPFLSTLQTVKSATGTWASKVSSMTGNDFAKSIKSGLGTVKSTLDGVLGDPAAFIASKLKAIPKYGELLALPFEGMSVLMGVFKEGADKIKSMGEAAMTSGTSLRDFQLINAALGGDAEATSKFINRVNRSLADARLAAEGTTDKFKNLIGVGSKELAAMGDAERYRAIAEGIRKIGDPMLQAKAAFELGGKSAAGMLKDLGKGAEGFDKNSGMLEAMGGVFGDNDLANVKKYEESTKAIKMFREAVSNQTTMALGAILAQVAETLGKAGLSAKGLAGWIVTVAEYVRHWLDATLVRPIRFVCLAVETLWLGFKGIAYAVVWLGDKAADIFDEMIKKVAEFTLSMTAVSPEIQLALKGLKSQGIDLEAIFMGTAKNGISGDFRDKLKKFRDELGDNIQGHSDGIAGRWKSWVGSGNAITAFFDGVRDKMNGTSRAIEMVNPFALWGDRAQKVLDGLKGPLGEFKDQFAEVRTLMNSGNEAARMVGKAKADAQIGALLPKLGNEGFFNALGINLGAAKKLLADTLTPKALPNIFELMGKPDAGFEYLGKNFLNLAKGFQEPPKLAGANLFDTREAYSAVVKFQNGSQDPLDVQKAIKGILEETKRLQEENVRVGKEVAAALKELGIASI